MNSKRAFVFVLAISGASWTVKADANCNETSSVQSDQDLWKVHGCWKDYFNWHYKAYYTTSGDWGGRGFYDACNQNKEYPKHWNAAYLISYGLADDNNHSFHSGQKDYQEMSRGRSSSEWHDGFHHQVSDDLSFLGQWVHAGPFGNSLLITSCNLYDVGKVNAGPGSRGGDFVHEATHSWLRNHGFVPDHHTNPNGGKCTLPGANCDYFYWHKLRNYVFGALWEQDGTGNRFHSPNQSQVEYLCDVSDFPAKWAKASIRIEAALDPNTRAMSRFINGPGYSCGNVRPW
jgi:hypothetical protein